MTDSNWWKEKLMEEYIQYEYKDDREREEVKELILREDGVYREKGN